MAILYAYHLSFDIPKYKINHPEQENDLQQTTILNVLYWYGGLDINSANGFNCYRNDKTLLAQQICVVRLVKSTWLFHSDKSLDDVASALSILEGRLYYVVTEIKDNDPFIARTLYEERLQSEMDAWIENMQNREGHDSMHTESLIGVGKIVDEVEESKDLIRRIEALPKHSILHNIKK